MATSFTDQDDCYKMNASPKGICLIINNFEFELSENLDTGPADRENLTRIFDELDFEVRYFENLTCEEMKRQMYNIKKTNHSNYDCFVCCISSHGNKTGVCGKDDSTLKIIDLQTYVYSRECPSLAGKPKVFFVDTCRGEEGHRGLYLHQPRAPAQGRRVVITDKRDFLLSFATTPDNKSYNNPDPTKGSVYFYHLTLLLKRHAKSKPVLRILEMVNEALTNAHPEQHLQTAENTSTLAKELRFHHPVQATVTALDQAFARLEFENQPSRPTHRQTKSPRLEQILLMAAHLQGDPQPVSNVNTYHFNPPQPLPDLSAFLHYGGQETSRPPRPLRPPSLASCLPDARTCSSCTYINDPGCSWCEICGQSMTPMQAMVTASRPALRFHDNHGEHVVLSNNHQTAVYNDNDNYEGGIVLSRDHIEVNKLYERVSDVGKALVDLPVDSRVGLSLDPSRSLHLHVNGADQGVVPCRSLPDPCWALWELNWYYPEITSLPVRDLS